MNVLPLLFSGYLWPIPCAFGLVLILLWYHAYFSMKRKEKRISARIEALRFGSSLIPICPLLGILGTVWGLMNTLSFMGSPREEHGWHRYTIRNRPEYDVLGDRLCRYRKPLVSIRVKPPGGSLIMGRPGETARGIAEGLLPLLDVSILLLGFFMMLFAMGAFQQQEQETRKSSEASLPGIGQIILLKVSKSGALYISVNNKGTLKRVSPDRLRFELENAKRTQRRGESLVLVYYEDPWAYYPSDLLESIVEAVRAAKCRYARAYP